MQDMVWRPAARVEVNGLEITVIYTDRDGDERHLISAWRSEPHERRHYWQNLEAAQDRH